MKKSMVPPGEDYTIRCPRLGHLVAFSYCRLENQGHPCRKILDCWYEHFMIEDYLRRELPPEAWERLFHRPAKSKLLSLVEMIEEAKRNKEGET